MPRTSDISKEKKAAPSPAIRNRRDYLDEMARRGTTHEAAVAHEKLARLEARYDFLAKRTEILDDIFAGWGKLEKSKAVAPLVSVGSGWRDVASLVKWIFKDKFGIASSWRETPHGTDLVAGIAEADLGRIRPLAGSLLNDMIAICREFSQDSPTTELERSPFLAGLYEGLMNEPRKIGCIVPGRSPIARKNKLRTKKNTQHQAALHPYDIGRETGQNMRINTPVETLCKQLRQKIEGLPEME